MATAEQKIQQLAIELPRPPGPVGAYLPVVCSGRTAFTSGQLPVRDGALTATGKVPDDVPIVEAQVAARQAALNALAAVKARLGSLDRIRRIVRVNVFVNSSPGFTGQAKVADGASELLTEIFGDPGRHTRTAIGAAELPLNSPVELDLIAEIAP